MNDRFRAAAVAYLIYGLFYWVGGLYLVSQGVGAAGGRGGDTGSSLVAWGLLGLVPLVVIPALLWRPWSWLGGWISRRSFAWVVAIFLGLRVWAVGRVAVRGGGMVVAPWGGEITFRRGAIAFLAVTVVALLFVARAAWAREPGSPQQEPVPR
ncbi:MAG: hypothetical protein ACREKS_02000 [Candidatus Rokuibacteriota bacterium]